MDLSKAFDSLHRDLLWAKLETYGLENNAVSFVRSYLTNRLQHCKRKNSFSDWAKISAGVPRGFILGPLLFNIFINDIFLFLQKCDLANYDDGSTMYTSDKRVSTIIDSLRNEFTILPERFCQNFMVLIPEKCTFMLLASDDLFQTNLVSCDKIGKSARCSIRQ